MALRAAGGSGGGGGAPWVSVETVPVLTCEVPGTFSAVESGYFQYSHALPNIASLQPWIFSFDVSAVVVVGTGTGGVLINFSGWPAFVGEGSGLCLFTDSSFNANYYYMTIEAGGIKMWDFYAADNPLLPDILPNGTWRFRGSISGNLRV